MDRLKSAHPDRPQNRISSTFVSDIVFGPSGTMGTSDTQFWHLSPDHLLVPETSLRHRAEERFGPQKKYGSMLVGDQVQQCVDFM
jgi:hypothetical protein